MNQKGSAVLIGLLIVVVLFIGFLGGVVVTKVLSTKISPTTEPEPSPSPQISITPFPTPTPSNIKKYKNSKYGIEFDYPSYMYLNDPTDYPTLSISLYNSEEESKTPAASISLWVDLTEPYSVPEGPFNAEYEGVLTVDGRKAYYFDDKAYSNYLYRTQDRRSLPNAGGCPYPYKIHIPYREGKLTISSCNVEGLDFTPQLQVILDSLKITE